MNPINIAEQTGQIVPENRCEEHKIGIEDTTNKLRRLPEHLAPKNKKNKPFHWFNAKMEVQMRCIIRTQKTLKEVQ